MRSALLTALRRIAFTAGSLILLLAATRCLYFATRTDVVESQQVSPDKKLVAEVIWRDRPDGTRFKVRVRSASGARDGRTHDLTGWLERPPEVAWRANHDLAVHSKLKPEERLELARGVRVDGLPVDVVWLPYR